MGKSENEQLENEQFNNLSRRIPYDVGVFSNYDNYENVLKDMLKDAKFIALSQLYPYEDFSEYNLPKRYWDWQIRACCELYQLAGKEGITTYSENGLSWTRYSDGLSKKLFDELIPNVGTPQKIQAVRDNDKQPVVWDKDEGDSDV